jgi:hypothetical protein
MSGNPWLSLKAAWKLCATGKQDTNWLSTHACCGFLQDDLILLRYGTTVTPLLSCLFKRKPSH